MERRIVPDCNSLLTSLQRRSRNKNFQMPNIHEEDSEHVLFFTLYPKVFGNIIATLFQVVLSM